MRTVAADGLFQWLFGQGWWSVGIVLTSVIGFGFAYLIATESAAPA
jgi:hypothetical protein